MQHKSKIMTLEEMVEEVKRSEADRGRISQVLLQIVLDAREFEREYGKKVKSAGNKARQLILKYSDLEYDVEPGKLDYRVSERATRSVTAAAMRSYIGEDGLAQLLAAAEPRWSKSLYIQPRAKRRSRN